MAREGSDVPWAGLERNKVFQRGNLLTQFPHRAKIDCFEALPGTTIFPPIVQIPAGQNVKSLQPNDNIVCNGVWTWHGYCSPGSGQPTGGDA
jgi:hypothetical protein